MARISGVDLPKNKRMEVALTYIYGIGKTRAKQILKDSGVSPDTKTNELADSKYRQSEASSIKRSKWRAICAEKYPCRSND